MSRLTDQIATTGFWPLPRACGPDGAPRRIGIEIEMGGLTEAEVSEIAQRLLGGDLEHRAPHKFRLTQSAVGTLRIYLDTAYRDSMARMGRLGVDLARNVVPVEIVTDPLPPESLPEIERLRIALRDGGAAGSRTGIGHGFGVHLNPALAGTSAADILPVVRSFALLEDWLRMADPIDLTRRVLPFVHRYPRAFVDALARDGAAWGLEDLWPAYLDHNPSRNRGLDLLPIMAELAPALLLPLQDQLGKLSARPAYHYRLPDSRIDEAGWSIAYEHNRWVMVERVAASPRLLARLSSDWLDHRQHLTSLRRDWRLHVEEVLHDAGIAEATWTAP
ncbi:amidoligase family protein [Halodurantibacterium flavum]|uniref:Amidoligase family protein n=1 Tax=Halodurantibacterium flavum TaxID=1382802 RepID=A0ABW4S625_9RHOB